MKALLRNFQNKDFSVLKVLYRLLRFNTELIEVQIFIELFSVYTKQSFLYSNYLIR
ncbi:uncharacterized protein Smp_203760 [Schistosoma mansoni]|uniref:uncharacterized protein n=1 Tax=Schistosoma mansoni TaxID=6183 RepID=UPI00022DCC0F|nr:uncharacterized protein Smp_203760 [Schistosoma mansoni]|eukprot:XP_018655119.1 uncharacterized protein Smp_203760 [Schistosoma mansoni]